MSCVVNLCLFHGAWCCGCRAYYTPNAPALSTASMFQLFHAYRRFSFLPVQKGSKDTPEGRDFESAKVLHFPSIAGQMEYKMSCPPDSFAPLGSPHSNGQKGRAPFGYPRGGAKLWRIERRRGVYSARWEFAMPGRAAALPGIVCTGNRLIPLI